MAKRGRPRVFDEAVVLEKAMYVFWKHGYEGASLGRLTEAMNINPPSLYATFGSKEQLFRAAVRLYRAVETNRARQALHAAATARDGVAAMLMSYAEIYAAADRPTGCLTVLAATTVSVENDQVRAFLADLRRTDIDDLQRRIDQGVDDGDVPARTDTRALAEFYAVVTWGMAIRARDGASAVTLRMIARNSSASWDAILAAG